MSPHETSNPIDILRQLGIYVSPERWQALHRTCEIVNEACLIFISPLDGTPKVNSQFVHNNRYDVMAIVAVRMLLRIRVEVLKKSQFETMRG